MQRTARRYAVNAAGFFKTISGQPGGRNGFARILAVEAALGRAQGLAAHEAAIGARR
ncbi:MAG TPA: hypothetical protein VEJ39_04600 [Candidatus Acidoferrales bacterium]|nr:hypothetical protein [Candidatus Acidoferrales bacterium]